MRGRGIVSPWPRARSSTLREAHASRGKRAPKRRCPRAQRSTVLLRWCVVGAAGFVALPLLPAALELLRDARVAERARRRGAAAAREERSRLQARLADSATVAALSREARRMSLVRPGERLFIVKGVAQWRRAQARHAGATHRASDG